MKKEEFEQFLKDANKENIVTYMLDNDWAANNDVTILDTHEFVDTYAGEPSTLARFIRDGELNLDCAYVRTGVYYKDATEADSIEDLIEDDEVEDYIDYLVDTTDPEEYDDVLISAEV